MRRFLFPLAALSVAAVLPLVGCGSGNQLTAKVKGTVKHKGAPIKAGAVSYYHESLGVYNSVIDKEGKYEIETLPSGNYSITVDTNAYDPDRKQATYGAQRGPGAPGGGDETKRGGGGNKASGGDKANAKRQEKQKEERANAERQGGYGPPPPKTKEELAELFTKLDDKYVDRTKTPLKATLKNGSNEVNLDAD
jgi:hypothetical protein